MSRRYEERVPIGMIDIAANVRRSVRDVSTLAESVAQFGILEPLVGCPSEDGTRVDLLMGQRRLAAAKEAGLAFVPMVLRDRVEDRDRVLMQLAENNERDDMTPIDEALAYADLMAAAMNRSQIARAVHRTPTEVGLRLKLLDLPETVRVAVDLRWISPTAALEIPIGVLGDPESLKRLAATVRLGDEALRSWIRSETNRHAARGHRVQRTGVRVISCSIDAYELARETAKSQGLPMQDWLSDLILSTRETVAA